jgi:hypothetical protein
MVTRGRHTSYYVEHTRLSFHKFAFTTYDVSLSPDWLCTGRFVFLHMTLPEKPTVCTCRNSVQWSVDNPFAGIHSFQPEVSRSLDSLFESVCSRSKATSYAVQQLKCTDCVFLTHTSSLSLRARGDTATAGSVHVSLAKTSASPSFIQRSVTLFWLPFDFPIMLRCHPWLLKGWRGCLVLWAYREVQVKVKLSLCLTN